MGMEKMQLRSGVSLLGIAIIVSSTIVLAVPVRAQSPQNRDQLQNLFKQKAASLGRSSQYLPDEFKTEKLTGIVDLPEVPQYTGKAVFISGMRYPKDRSGARIVMTLGVQEFESDVLEWYKSALKSYRWILAPSTSTDKLISAAKNNNSFTIQISPSRTPGFRTMMVLSYKFGI